MSRLARLSPSRPTLAVLATLCLLITVVVPAYAVHDVGIFQLDRNAQTSVQSAVPATDDWDKVCPVGTPPGAVSCIGGISAQATTFDTDGVDASIFTGGGSKDDLNTTGWLWKNGSVPPKDDLAHAYAVRYANGLLYFGADRTANNGDSQIGFWFFQGNVGPQPGGTFGPDAHQNGDILILSDFTNGGATVTIRVFQWHSPGGSINGTLDILAGTTTTPADCVGSPLGTGDHFCATVNIAATPSPWAFTDKGGTPTGNFAPGEFYEGGVDLAFLGLQDECFSSFLAETRSSQSVDATLKDFVGGGFGVCSATLSTTPSAGAGGTVTPGTIVTDTATVTGTSPTKTPTGNVTFYICSLLATGTCSAGTQVGSPKPLGGSGGTATATSDGFNTAGLAAGRYCFRATWPGDSNYPVPLSHSGTGNSECFNIAKLSPALTTQASGTIVVGSGSLSDIATLSGATANATGTISFNLYGPNDATCATSIFSSTATVSGNGNYNSGSFTPTTVGTYRWIANYSGDANNNGTANGCNEANEATVVGPRNPALTTQASVPIVIGSGSLSDVATLSGATANATGTITFNLYGPNDATCATSIFISTATVTGNGNYTSGSFTPTTVGTYSWIANYGGDANNTATSNGCNEANESTIVSPRNPTLTTQASATITLGGSLTDVATLSGATSSATGTITFNLYGPNDATCASSIFSSVVNVNGNGNYTSASFAPTAVGTYRWIANYSGDINNTATANGCNAANESVDVTDTSSTETAQNWLPNDSATITTAGGSPLNGTLSFTLYASGNCTGTVLRDAETFNLSDAASGLTYNTTNTTVKVLASTTVSWKVVFTSSSTFVGSSSKCETTTLSIVN